jgi:hypothetical protein
LRPHISYSELSNFATGCQWRWKLDYLENRRAEVFSIHFDFGTAVHEALELHLTRKEPISVDEAVHVFRTRLQELVKEQSSRYPQGQSFKLDELLQSGENIIRCVRLIPELRDAEVVHNEFPLLEQIGREDGVDMKFKGFIDIVLKSKDKRGNTILWICDFKTCSWGWDRDARADRWKHYQLFLYKYYLCKKFDIDPKMVRTAFILLKKRPPKGSGPIEFFPVSAGPVSVQRALDVLGENITEMIEREKDGSFQKDRSQCVSKFGETCPYYKTPLCPQSP